jgi:hypothetical protein
MLVDCFESLVCDRWSCPGPIGPFEVVLPCHPCVTVPHVPGEEVQRASKASGFRRVFRAGSEFVFVCARESSSSGITRHFEQMTVGSVLLLLLALVVPVVLFHCLLFVVISSVIRSCQVCTPVVVLL